MRESSERLLTSAFLLVFGLVVLAFLVLIEPDNRSSLHLTKDASTVVASVFGR